MDTNRVNLILSHPLPYKDVDTSEPDEKNLVKTMTLGEGTYGKVFEVSDRKPMLSMSGKPLPLMENIGQAYALKENYTTDFEEQEGNVEGTMCSVRELDFLNLVKYHPYCISMKKAIVENIKRTNRKGHKIKDKISFLLEKGDCDGENYLHSSKYQPLVNDRKLFILYTFLATEFLASRGIYHRDIKPANIICFLDNEGRLDSAKLTDFGLAMYYTKQIAPSSRLVTLWYRAPEIALCRQYGKKSDVWSLGCMLFETFSKGNKRFIACQERALIPEIFSKRPVSREIYNLAKRIYKDTLVTNYKTLQGNMVSMKEQLNYSMYEIEQFNSTSIKGRKNHGTYDELVDLLEKILEVDHKKRYSISDALNHEFFSGYREIIDRTRLQFGIDSRGKWIMKPIPTLTYKPSNIRETASKWFKMIYENRFCSPVCLWYHHRILFHAIEMFDRYLVLENPTDANDAQVVVWIDTFLFISSKYFRAIYRPFSANYFSMGIKKEEQDMFLDKVSEFEEKVVKDIFKFKIYSPTIYETSPEILSETTIAYMLKLVLSNNVKPETSHFEIWEKNAPIIDNINKKIPKAKSPIALE